jgi:hypothetical protein
MKMHGDIAFPYSDARCMHKMKPNPHKEEGSPWATLRIRRAMIAAARKHSTMTDFFISYTGADQTWAEWIEKSGGSRSTLGPQPGDESPDTP